MSASETKKDYLPDVMDVLEKHYALKEHGLDWRDGERTQHEMWRMYPPRRFNSYAITSLYIFASQFCPPDAKILDFGCGTGFGSYLFAAKTKARSVLGIDLDKSAVSWGQKRYVRPNLTLNCVNLHDPSLDQYTGKMDFVYCSNVMEHVEQYREALARIHSLLKPGGLYYHVTPPSGEARGNPYHITNFKIPRWKMILEDIGFHSQRFFSHKSDLEKEMVRSEFDFTFTECGPDDMFKSAGMGSMSGIILARKSFNPDVKSLYKQADMTPET